MLRILLKFLLYFILFYYLYKIVDKALFGDRKEAERLRKQQQKQWEKFYKEYKKREGTVTISNTAPSSKKIRKDEGEYVDYEEVK